MLLLRAIRKNFKPITLHSVTLAVLRYPASTQHHPETCPNPITSQRRCCCGEVLTFNFRFTPFLLKSLIALFVCYFRNFGAGAYGGRIKLSCANKITSS